jgi:hypothetical protein
VFAQAAPASEAPPAPAPQQPAPWDIDVLVDLYLHDPANLPPLPADVLRQVHDRAQATPTP